MYAIILYKSFENLKRKKKYNYFTENKQTNKKRMTKIFSQLMKTLNFISVKLKRLHTQETLRK